MEQNYVDSPPERRGFYLVHGPEVSAHTEGEWAVWRWDGARWWCEDGTETADPKQMIGAFWYELLHQS